MRGYSVVAKVSKNHPSVQMFNSILLSPELIAEYLDALLEKGCTAETQKAYQVKLEQLYQYLPEDKLIRADTLTQWRTALVEAGYAPRTVNVCIAAANGLVAYCGHREFQVEKPLKCDCGIQPELTRSEYLRLLQTAKNLGKHRAYLLVKLFGTVALTPRCLYAVTVEAVRDGWIILPGERLRIPPSLQSELLSYARNQGLSSGPVFITRKGNVISRVNAQGAIFALAKDAVVPSEKCNPRCLRKLCLETQAGIRANVELLAEQNYDHLLETEQLMVAWEEPAIS